MPRSIRNKNHKVIFATAPNKEANALHGAFSLRDRGSIWVFWRKKCLGYPDGPGWYWSVFPPIAPGDVSNFNDAMGPFNTSHEAYADAGGDVEKFIERKVLDYFAAGSKDERRKLKNTIKLIEGYTKKPISTQEERRGSSGKYYSIYDQTTQKKLAREISKWAASTP